ncbi:hypothetical protein CTAYLR_006225 [Chrysophaeum taylorii]|uniref:Uncharacterized protein n=1 Tax=Chrysophaeum taylorii TaxID=2483200 RepID=A0AAD7U7I4_9STRA|nr:hypothetical protein CTAYLR_006225 [Chrysophaeum taylorii]
MWAAATIVIIVVVVVVVVHAATIEVVVLTNQIGPSSATLASVCSNTKAPLRLHVIVPDALVVEAAHRVIPPACARAEWRRVVAESAVVRRVRESGFSAAWEIPAPPPAARARLSARPASSSSSSFPAEGRNVSLRFYLPLAFADLEEFVLIEDDVIVQGDLSRLWELDVAYPMSAGCLRWRRRTSCPSRMESASNLSRVEVQELGLRRRRRCESDEQRECVPAGFFESLALVSLKLFGEAPRLKKRAWNFGLNKINATAWRIAQVTERYVAWVEANRKFGWFPRSSLDVGIPFLALPDVKCLEDADMPVLSGLGFVEPDDLELNGVRLDALGDMYALQWTGKRKPYDSEAAIPEYLPWYQAHAPPPKPPRRQQPHSSVIVWTAPRSGSEWFMDVLDHHPNVCASGEATFGSRGWPRESLLPSEFPPEVPVKPCDPRAMCSWASVSSMLERLFRVEEEEEEDPCARSPNEAFFGGWHLGAVCALRDQALAGAGGVMQEAFRIFIAHVLGGRSSLRFPCGCPVASSTTATKIMAGWMKPGAEVYNLEAFAGILEDLNAKVIFLERANLVASYVSLRVAELTGNFHCGGCRREGRVTVDVDDLRQFLRYRIKQRRDHEVFLSRFDVHRVEYDECIADEPECFRRVFAFLGVDSEIKKVDTIIAEASEDISRDNRTLAERVINYDAVISALREHDDAEFVVN